VDITSTGCIILLAEVKTGDAKSGDGTMKLVKVGEGLYRDDSGNVTVIQNYLKGRGLRWIVRHTNWIGCQVRKEFRTLADVRAYLKS
jgi:hypothetical protein